MEPVNIALEPLLQWPSVSIEAFVHTKLARNLIICDAIACIVTFVAGPREEIGNTGVIALPLTFIIVWILLLWIIFLYLASFTNRALFWRAWKSFDVIVVLAAWAIATVIERYERWTVLSMASQLSPTRAVIDISEILLIFFPGFICVAVVDAWTVSNLVKTALLALFLLVVVWIYVRIAWSRRCGWIRLHAFGLLAAPRKACSYKPAQLPLPLEEKVCGIW